mmetsp:Transcript_8131/g.9179  ORF Transcript_8131/g.9179 Transcript_8131/m.9179 type:complete len:373 (+) Transcript_8131:63-1181(+)
MGCQTDKDAREPSPIVLATAEARSVNKFDEKNSAKGASSINNVDGKKMELNSRQNSLTDDIHLSRLKTDYQLNAHLDCVPIIHSLDLVANKLVSYNLETQAWSSNNFARAALYNSNPFKIPLKPLQEEVICHLENATPVFTSEATVHFIGPKHFALDVKQNIFSYKQNRDSEIENPTICRLGDDIFALSGQEGDEYTTKCEKYNVLQNTWTPIASLNRPYYKGSACPIQDSNGNYKIVILGGLYSAQSSSTNQFISVYDIATNKWTESKIKLSHTTDSTAPSFPLFPREDGSIAFITTKEDKLHYNTVNISSGKMSFKRELITKEKVNNITIESFATSKGNLSLVLADRVPKADLKPASEKSKTCVMISVKI